jgi:micrococcal nuclease
MALVCSFANAFASEPETANGEGRTEAEDWRTVTRVIDGDTIVLDGGERVRLIGVDTPETVHPQKPVEYFGKEASAFTRRTVEGKRVRLEYEPGPSRTDRYSGTLAYVYLGTRSSIPSGAGRGRELAEQT